MLGWEDTPASNPLRRERCGLVEPLHHGQKACFLFVVGSNRIRNLRSMRTFRKDSFLCQLDQSFLCRVNATVSALNLYDSHHKRSPTNDDRRLRFALSPINRWADRRVLEACRKLTAEQYVAEPAPGWVVRPVD